MAANESAYRFGEFRLIPAQRELWCSDRLVSVQPKVLDTLVYLIQHRDRAVGRDELMSAVWGCDDINDNVLRQMVARARLALGDTAEAQHTIRTVARFGYRWIRDVEVCPTRAEPAPESERPIEVHALRPEPMRPIPQPARAWPRRTALVATLALAGVVGVAGWMYARHLGTDARKAAATAMHTQPQRRLPSEEVATWSEAQRLQRLHGLVLSNQLDLAQAALRALSDENRALPEVRCEAATVSLKEGRFDEAFRAYKSLLFDLGEHGPPAILGAAFYGAGQAQFRQGMLVAAEPYFKLAIQVLPKASPREQVTLGMAWTSLGRLYSMRKAFDKAEHAYAQARMTLEETGDVVALSELESNVGVTLIARYRYPEALPRFQRAAELAARTNDANAEVRARMNLINVQLVLLQPADALQSESRLRALREQVGDPVLAAHVDLVRAKALIANGKLDDASVALQVQAARPVAPEETLTATRQLVAADLAFAQGNLDAGSRSVRALLNSDWGTSEDDGVMAYPLWQWMESSKAMGDSQGAADAAAAADTKGRDHPELPTLALYAALARAESAEGRGDVDGARAEFERALAQAEAKRVPFDVVRAVASYTEFLLRHGKEAEAGVVAERIAGWADQDYAASLVRLSVYHAAGSEAWRSALARTQALAGERKVPPDLTSAPSPATKGDQRVLLAGHLL